MLIVFKWDFFCAGAPSISSLLLYALDHEKPGKKTPTKKSHRGWSDLRINTSKYNCKKTWWAFESLPFQPLREIEKNKETILILVLQYARIAPKTAYEPSIPASHYVPNATWLFLPQPQQFKWKIMNGFEHGTLYQLFALLSSLWL